MSNPSLLDLQNKRRQIRSRIVALCEEDRELFQAEKTLIRVGGILEKPVLPLAMLTPSYASGSYAITARLHPEDFSDADIIAAERQFADFEDSQDAEDYEPDDGGDGLLDLVRQVTVGSETLEQLTLLLFRNCGDTWWTATEIQDYLQRLKGKEVPMSSISPMLTALKHKGLIARSGHNVALVEKAMSEALK